MKGIILSGGSGTRLYPLTTMVNKQLLPVYDKPMVYYPLTTLINGGMNEILLITSPQYVDCYKNLLGDGSKWGLNIQYKIQEKPEGLAQALILAEEFLNGECSCVILGDNIFHGSFYEANCMCGSVIYGYEVKDPRAYGVVEFDEYGRVKSLEEKPMNPKSNYSIPGIYMFDSNAPKYAKSLKPSIRGELEIVDLLKVYLYNQQLYAYKMERGMAWLDAGTPQTLFQASSYIQSIQERQGVMVGCYEESCLKKGFISKEKFKESVGTLPKGEYRSYLERLI